MTVQHDTRGFVCEMFPLPSIPSTFSRLSGFSGFWDLCLVGRTSDTSVFLCYYQTFLGMVCGWNGVFFLKTLDVSLDFGLMSLETSILGGILCALFWICVGIPSTSILALPENI